MHGIKVQRVLIAYIKREAPQEWAVLRAELRREFAEKVAAKPGCASRVNLGQMYRQRKVALVIATARHISMHR